MFAAFVLVCSALCSAIILASEDVSDHAYSVKNGALGIVSIGDGKPPSSVDQDSEEIVADKQQGNVAKREGKPLSPVDQNNDEIAADEHSDSVLPLFFGQKKEDPAADKHNDWVPPPLVYKNSEDSDGVPPPSVDQDNDERVAVNENDGIFGQNRGPNKILANQNASNSIPDSVQETFANISKRNGKPPSPVGQDNEEIVADNDAVPLPPVDQDTEERAADQHNDVASPSPIDQDNEERSVNENGESHGPNGELDRVWAGENVSNSIPYFVKEETLANISKRGGKPPSLVDQGTEERATDKHKGVSPPPLDQSNATTADKQSDSVPPSPVNQDNEERAADKNGARLPPSPDDQENTVEAANDIGTRKETFVDGDAKNTVNTSAKFRESGRQIKELRRLDHIDRVPKKTVFPISLRAGGNGVGDGPLSLSTPHSVFVDDSGYVYVSDTGNHRVQRWSPQGHSAETVAGGGGKGRSLSKLRFPRGISVHAPSGNLFVADSGNHRVLRWPHGAVSGAVLMGFRGELRDKQGNVVASEENCCRAGRDPGHLISPSGVFVDSGGSVYVADTGNNRIQFWDSTSDSVSVVSDIGFLRPEGVFVHSGNVYVADTGNHRVVVFQYPPPPSSAVAVNTVAGGKTIGHATGDPGALASPTGIWIDNSLVDTGGSSVLRLFVVDSHTHRVTVHRLTGDAVAAGGCLQAPSYVKLCHGGGLHYPPDPKPDGIDDLNPSNMNPPIYYLHGPRGLHVEAKDNSGSGDVRITVADSQNHRVPTWF